MVKVVTFGYRWEGMMLHQWAYVHSDLVAVVLPENRLDNPISQAIIGWSKDCGVPILVHSGSDEIVSRLKSMSPDIILCCCYTYKLSTRILGIPHLGCVNIHPGKLPEYKGRRPIEDALNHGDSKLWVSLHYMNQNYDSGKAIAERAISRGNLNEMRSHLTKVGLQLLEEKWDCLTKK